MQADRKVKLARDSFPVVDDYAYFDTASVGPVSSVYTAALTRCTDEDLRMGRAMRDRFDRIDRARSRIRAEVASLLGADPNQIELTQGTTDGIRTLLERLTWSERDEIVTTQLEFPACTEAISDLARDRRVSVRVAQVPASGADDLGWLERCVTAKTRLIFFSGVAFANGLRLPIDRIAEFAVERGVRTLVDGAQLVGAIDLDLSRTAIDYLALPLQKWLCGPEGLGALYTRRGRQDALYPARSVHGWPVLQAAAEHLQWMREAIGWRWIHRRTLHLAACAREVLGQIAPLSLLTPEEHAGIVAVRCPKGMSDGLFASLQSKRVIVRHRPELDLLRISTAFFTTEDDIDGCAKAIR